MTAEIDRLLAEIEDLPDPRARALAKALATELVDLVGATLRRTVELGGDTLARALADDPLVGSVLVLCDQHPDSAAVRIARALDGASAELRGLGIGIVAVEPTAIGVHVRLRGGGGTRAADEHVRALVETLAIARAPDLEVLAVEIDGRAVMPAGFVAIERLRSAP